MRDTFADIVNFVEWVAQLIHAALVLGTIVLFILFGEFVKKTIQGDDYVSPQARLAIEAEEGGDE